MLRNNMHLQKPKTLEDTLAYLGEFENLEKLYEQLSQEAKSPKQDFNKINFNKAK